MLTKLRMEAEKMGQSMPKKNTVERNFEEVKKVFNQISNKYTGIDVLINNAGFGDCGYFTKTNLEKDISKLADILGHSNIETTRIYIMTTGSEHRRQIEKMGLALIGSFT